MLMHLLLASVVVKFETFEMIDIVLVNVNVVNRVEDMKLPSDQIYLLNIFGTL